MSKLIYILIFIVYIIILGDAIADELYYQNSILWTDIKDVKVRGDYAYCAYTNGLIILDVSDPAAPEFCGRLYLPGNSKKISLRYNSALIAAGGGGLYIVDITEPTCPEIIENVGFPGSLNGIETFGDYAIIAASTGFWVIDILIPDDPYVLSHLDAVPSVDISVDDQYAYVAADDYGFYIVNLNNPFEPDILGELQFSEPCLGIDVHGNFAYIAQDRSGLIIVDISDPADPSVAGGFPTPWYAFEVEITDSVAFIANWDGVYILDISTPDYPSFISYCDTPERAIEITISENYAFVVDWNGLQIIDAVDIENPFLIGEYIESYDINWDFNIEGNYLYANGLTIWDIANPSNPINIGRLDLDIYALDYCIEEDYACIAANTAGTYIIDITDKTNPALINCIEPITGSRAVFCKDNYLYSADEWDGLRIYDITSPESPLLLSRYSIPENRLMTITVVETYAYLAYGYEGLIVLDVEDPSNPVFVSSFPPSFFAWHANVSDTLVFLSCANDIKIIDVGDPFNPEEIISIPSLTPVRGSYYDGQYLYLANYDLLIYDISDILRPFEIDDYTTPDNAVNVFSRDGYIYIADRASLMILSKNQVEIVITNILPTTFQIDSYPNPFNAAVNISFSLPTAGEVRGDIYDLLGRHVAIVVDEYLFPGYHSVSWNGTNDAGEIVPSGIYFGILKAGKVIDKRKFTLLR